MSIPLPKLDDRTYADLVEEMRALIPRYASDNWTNHNVSDPGITLLELLAWLTEALIYRLNRIPEASQVRLLELLGAKFQLARPARVNLEVTAEGLKDDLILPYGTRLIACTGQGGMPLPFETIHDLKLTPAELKGIVQARQIDRVEDECLGKSDGQPHQRFGLNKAGLVQAFLAGNSTGVPLGLEVKVGGRPWTHKQSLLDLSAADFIVEPLPGIILPSEEEKATASYGSQWGIRFGSGSLGYIPPQGEQITASYRYTFGRRGNISSQAKFDLDYRSISLPAPVSFSFEYPGDVTEGTDPAGLAEAQDHVTQDLKRRWRAVTQKDFEGVREEAKKFNRELNLARVKCLPRQDLSASDPDTPRAGHVSVIAVPPPQSAVLVKLPYQVPIKQAAFSPDGRWLAVVSDGGKVEIWDVRRTKKVEFWDEPKWVTELPVPHQAPFPVTFSPEGRWLVTGGNDNIIRIWGPRFLFSVKLEFLSDLAEGVLSLGLRQEFENYIQQLPPHGATKPKPDSPARVNQMSLSLDAAIKTEEKGKLWRIDDKGQIYYVVKKGQALDIYDADGWEKVRDLPPHAAPVEAVAFRPDGRRLATVSGDPHTVRIWDIWRGEPVIERPHTAGIEAVAFSPDGRGLATVSGDLHTVRIWDIERRELVAELPPHTAPVEAVAFRPDGRRLATVADNTVHLWKVQTTPQQPASFSYKLKSEIIAKYSPDLRWLVTAVDDHAQVWDLDTRAEAAVLYHQAPISCVRFSLDGRRLATLSPANQASIIRVWDVPAGRELAVLQPCDASRSLEFSLDGRWLATLGQAHLVQVWASEHLQSTQEFLEERRLITICHHVVGPTFTEVGLRVEVVHLPRVSETELRKKIEAALKGFFNPLEGGGPEKQGWPFGQDVYTSEIYEVIEKVEGVDHIESLTLRTRGAYALTVNKNGDGLIRSPAEDKLWQEDSNKITIAPDKLVHFVLRPKKDIILRTARS